MFNPEVTMLEYYLRNRPVSEQDIAEKGDPEPDGGYRGSTKQADLLSENGFRRLTRRYVQQHERRVWVREGLEDDEQWYLGCGIWRKVATEGRIISRRHSHDRSWGQKYKEDGSCISGAQLRATALVLSTDPMQMDFYHPWVDNLEDKVNEAPLWRKTVGCPEPTIGSVSSPYVRRSFRRFPFP